MIPEASAGLKALAARLLTDVVPALESRYTMSDTAMLGMLVTALADELESGIANRLVDIEAMTLLFQQARAGGLEVPAPPRLEASDYTLTRVNEAHDTYSRALISLHEKVEHDPDFEILNESIWRYLAANAERHSLSI